MSNNDTVAVKYLGRTSLALVIGMIICFLASLGYNTYIKSKKIEVQATNSNSTNLNTLD